MRKKTKKNLQTPHASVHGNAAIANGDQEPGVKYNYKDSIFRMIFKEKGALLSLYNGLNGTDYQDEDELEINTLENAIYMGHKNDVSFVIYGQVNLYEHQSTVNNNMPLRCLGYINSVYSKDIAKRELYGTKRISLSRPHFVVFYNGVEPQEEVKWLKLSDAFENSLYEGDEPELELKVRVININRGYSEKLKESCRLLNEYTIFISRVRENAKRQPIKEAVRRAIDDCIRDNVLRDFLIKNRAEVNQMQFYEYDFEEHMAALREESMEEGYGRGRIEGKIEGKIEGIIEFLLDLGSVPEELIDRIKSETDLETLKRWHKLTYKVDTAEEFAKLISRT